MFAPLLAVSDSIARDRVAIIFLLVTFGLWIVIIAFQLGLEPVEALFAFSANSILVLSYFAVSRYMNISVSLFAFILFGVSFDFINLDLQLVNDHLILADFFAGTNWTQWYSFTGILGGSFWILIVNTIVFFTFFRNNPIPKNKWRWRSIILILIVIIVPIIFSKNYLSGFEYPPLGNLNSGDIAMRWAGLLAAENPDNGVTSLWSMYGEYLGRTAVWLSLFLILSFFVRMKTK